MPYPGRPSNFIHLCGSWERTLDSGNSIRCVEFVEAKNKDSLLTKFILRGLKNGDVQLEVFFNKKNAEVIQKYFEAYQLPFQGQQTSFFSRTHEQLKILYKILTVNNEIDNNEFRVLLKNLCIKGTHEVPKEFREEKRITRSDVASFHGISYFLNIEI